MALSGIFYGTSSNPRIKPQISWSAKQSVAGNYSDVTAKLNAFMAELKADGTLQALADKYSLTLAE